MASAAFAAQIIVADLVDIERNQIEWRVMILAVPAVPVEEPVNNVLGVRVLEISGDDGG